MPNMGASIGQFHASEDRTGWAFCSVRTLTLKAIIFRANLPKSKAKRLSKLIKFDFRRRLMAGNIGARRHD
jgi:hypothetical protein